jgi:SAM-dependent methyltransferase
MRLVDTENPAPPSVEADSEWIKTGRLREKIASVVQVLRREGAGGVAQKLRHWLHYHKTQPRIDATYGTDTQAWMDMEVLDASGPNIAHARVYAPSPLYDAQEILKKLPINFSEYDFVDLGSGKGMMLLVAAEFGFGNVSGVEFGRAAYDVGLENLKKFRERRPDAPPVEMHLGDASAFSLPERPLVVYMFNPFGVGVIQTVLAGLEQSLRSTPRDCWIVYVNPVHHEVFAQCSFLAMEAAQLDRNKKAPYAIYRAKSAGR